MKIINKSIYLLIATLLVLLSTLFFVIIPVVHDQKLERKKSYIRDITKTVHDTILFYSNLAENGFITKEKAQQYSILYIRSLRYGKNNTNYFWILKNDGDILVNPNTPWHEGTNQLLLHDINDRYFIKEFIAVTKRDGCGFVSYKWHKGADKNIVFDKVGYVSAVKKWKWIIGTGVYLDDIRYDITILSTCLCFITFSVVITIAFIIFYLFKSFLAREKNHTNKIFLAKSSETKIKLMLEAMPDMIIRVNSSGNVLDVKEPVGVEPFIDPGKILGVNIDKVFPEEYLDDIKLAIDKSISTSNSEIILFSIKKDKKKLIKLEAYFIRCAKNETLITIRDITSRGKH